MLEVKRRPSPAGWLQVGEWLALAAAMGMVWWVGRRQDPGGFDDAYITYRYARHLAQGLGFAYNPGEAVLGTTTPLYALLLAGLSRLWPDIPRLSHGLSVAAWMGCVLLLWGLGRTSRRPSLGLLAAWLMATSALCLDVLGMETMVYILVILGAFWLAQRGQAIPAAVCAGAAFWLRWDGVLVVAVLVFSQWVQRWRLPWDVLVVCGALILPWLVYAQVTFGSIFPNTFFAKVGQGRNQGLGAQEIGAFGPGLLHVARAALTGNPLFTMLLGLAALGVWWAWRWRVAWWPLGLWTLAYLTGYVVLGVLRFPWYYPPLVPAFSLLVACGVMGLASLLDRPIRPPWALAGLSVLCVVASLIWLERTQRTQPDPHLVTYRLVGDWLAQHTPAASSVGLLEIGVVGYYSERRVVDTMGLVTPGMVGHLQDWFQTLRYAVNRYWPDYVVALAQTAWTGIVAEDWFQEAYSPAVVIENAADAVAPVTIYQRRDGYPPTRFALSNAPDARLGDVMRVRAIQTVESAWTGPTALHVQVAWEALADIAIDYRIGFELWSLQDGERQAMARGWQPWRGGAPTTLWRAGDELVDNYTLTAQPVVAPGWYYVRLLVDGPDGPLRDAGGIEATVGPLWVDSAESLPPAAPDLFISARWDDHIRLAAYNAQFEPGARRFQAQLPWSADSPPGQDYTLFVHILSPDGSLIAQHDAPPALPTRLWSADFPFVAAFEVTLPPALSPGDYPVRAGLYHWPDLTRLPVAWTGCGAVRDDAVELGVLSLTESGEGYFQPCALPLPP